MAELRADREIRRPEGRAVFTGNSAFSRHNTSEVESKTRDDVSGFAETTEDSRITGKSHFLYPDAWVSADEASINTLIAKDRPLEYHGIWHDHGRGNHVEW